MFRHLLKRSLVCMVLTLLFAWNASAESPEAERPQLPKLPTLVRQPLEHPHRGDAIPKADDRQPRVLFEVASS